MQLRLPALFLLLALPAYARIIVDDSAPEPPPEKPAIHVPGPKNGPAISSSPTQDTLAFLNKDQLHGNLLGIDSAGLHWQSPESAAPIVFRTAQISQVKLDSHKPDTAGKSAQRVGLTNGDQLPGNILTLDGTSLVLDTWYAGRLTIPRSVISRIIPITSTTASLYEGPTGLDGWTVGRAGSRRSWSFRDGALIGSNYGTIGRDMKLPDLSSIQFDAVIRGNSQFSIAIYSDHANNFGSCYMLQLSTGYTELQRYSTNGGSNDLGSTQLQNILRRDVSHFEIRTNKQKKSIWLMIDGKMVKEWTDPAEFNGAGGCVLFSCQPGTTVKISNIKVTKWDGKFDDTSATGEKSTDDSVELANEDKVTGHLLSIADGKAKFSSAYADLNIPIERVEEVDMAAAHATQVPQSPGDVRATFAEGGTVTMQLTQWDEKSCAATSANFNKATFNPIAFSKLLFNLTAQPQPSDTDDLSPDTDTPDQ